MYSEYTIYTAHTQYATYVFPIYSLLYRIYIYHIYRSKSLSELCISDCYSFPSLVARGEFSRRDGNLLQRTALTWQLYY